MTENDPETFKTDPETPVLGLKTPETVAEARAILGDLTTRYLAGGVSERMLRAATYAINGLVKALHLEKSLEVEARVAALEKARGMK